MRILIKISGESLGGDHQIIKKEHLRLYLHHIEQAFNAGIEIAVVVGGGNLFRGAQGQGLYSRECGDQIGMISTLINSLIIHDSLQVPSEIFSALNLTSLAKNFCLESVIKCFGKKVPIFATGIGQPYFSTDTAAALRAIQIQCDYVIKFTEVGGVYSADPKTNSDAVFLDKLTFAQVLDRQYRVMDLAAFDLCREHNVPIIITNIKGLTSFSDLIRGKNKATFISA